VLSNLLSNAVKFSPRGGEVVVAASAAARTVRIEVRDRGPGIDPEFHPQIFQKFAQADASDTRRRGGTGLGLAITRELVEQMHGLYRLRLHPRRRRHLLVRTAGAIIQLT
jgi:two-component system, OmpR family, sensor histidine kinase VicK